MANWGEIPDDIIHSFVNRLHCVEDFVRFGVVCKSWRSVTITQQQQQQLRFAPWLMINNTNNNDDILTFFSISTRQVFHLHLPQLQGRRSWGTPYGWLFTLGADRNIHLLNPLSQLQFSLPPQTTFPTSPEEEEYKRIAIPQHVCRASVTKFALASNPSFWSSSTLPSPPPNCLVMAIYGPLRELGFAVLGDEAWTNIDSSNTYEDLIFFNDQFYAVTDQGDVLLCDIDNSTPPQVEVVHIAGPPDGTDIRNCFYLIEMQGGLHLVQRQLEAIGDTPDPNFYYYTTLFIVFRFDFLTREWSEVPDLGDHALFVGNNTSFAISTATYLEFKPNSIYFTDDHYRSYRRPFCDMGVYDYETDAVEAFYYGDTALSEFSRPPLFMPAL